MLKVSCKPCKILEFAILANTYYLIVNYLQIDKPVSVDYLSDIQELIIPLEVNNIYLSNDLYNICVLLICIS